MSLLAKLMTIFRKQNLNGLRKFSGEWLFCSLFSTLNKRRRLRRVLWNPLLGDSGGRRKQRGEISGVGYKGKINTYFFFIGEYRLVNHEHLQHIEMASREQDNNDPSCGQVLWWLCPEGLGKEHYSDISEVCLLSYRQKDNRQACLR